MSKSRTAYDYDDWNEDEDSIKKRRKGRGFRNERREVLSQKTSVINSKGTDNDE